MLLKLVFLDLFHNGNPYGAVNLDLAQASNGLPTLIFAIFPSSWAHLKEYGIFHNIFKHKKPFERTCGFGNISEQFSSNSKTKFLMQFSIRRNIFLSLYHFLLIMFATTRSIFCCLITGTFKILRVLAAHRCISWFFAGGQILFDASCY